MARTQSPALLDVTADGLRTWLEAQGPVVGRVRDEKKPARHRQAGMALWATLPPLGALNAVATRMLPRDDIDDSPLARYLAGALGLPVMCFGGRVRPDHQWDAPSVCALPEWVGEWDNLLQHSGPVGGIITKAQALAALDEATSD